MSKTVTAHDVRAWFTDERVAALPEAARKCLSPTARGRLHPDVIKAFNAKRRKDSRYSSGNSNAVKAAAKAEAAALRALAVEQGVVKVGQVGPLPKAFLISQGVIKG